MTNEKDIQFVKGNDAQQEELIDFINYVFNMNGRDNDFYRNLPKIYKKEYHPCEYNYLTLENDRIVAAVGAFPGEVTVCDTKLKYYGIGNVAVNPYRRSKGYMQKLMDMAVDQMLEEDVDFSVLSGRRHRYSYFSYDLAGIKNCFWLDESNIKHSFGKNRKARFHFDIINESNQDTLQEIADLQARQPIYYHRESNKLYDILKNWNTVDIYGIYEETRFAGYLLNYNKNNIKELILLNQEDVSEVIADFINVVIKDGLTIEIPDYQRSFVNDISTFAENVSIQVVDNFTVFHYEKVIDAFLRLKAHANKLADGEITLLIHGKKMDEKLLISVKDNQVSVTKTDNEANYEYNHQEAMSLLFSNYSPLRSKMPFEVQTWLPLPIFIFPADQV
ncbi:MAG: GNAT family N-acetyltransferase [Mobilitalea sp.]